MYICIYIRELSNFSFVDLSAAAVYAGVLIIHIHSEYTFEYHLLSPSSAIRARRRRLVQLSGA